VAQEELHEMLHSCEVLSFMEQRTRMANHRMEGECEKLRHLMLKLEKEEEEIRALGEDAAVARRDAVKQLNETREAHADQQRAYEDCKTQRKTVAKEKKAGKEREKAFEEGERAAKLDGQGELDDDGELMLKQKSNDVQAARVATQIEKETAITQVSHAEEVFQRLRRATHDPESIATPAVLVVTMLSSKDRGLELQAQVDKTEQLSVQLGEEKKRLETDLQNFMYYGSSSQLLDDAEREFEPQLNEATRKMAMGRKRCASAKSLVHESKIGMALLTHLTLGDSIEKLVPDGEITNALERVERHLLGCLSAVNQAGARDGHRDSRGMKAEMARAAEAAAAAAAATASSEAADGYTTDEGGDEAKPLAPHPPAYPKPTGGGRTGGGDMAAYGAAAIFAQRMVNNVRVLTNAEQEDMLEDLPDEEQEGYDENGNELTLTRRTKRQTGGKGKDRKGARKGGGHPSSVPSSRSGSTSGARANAPGVAAPLQ